MQLPDLPGTLDKEALKACPACDTSSCVKVAKYFNNLFLLDLTRKPINVRFSHKHIKVMALFPFPSRGFKRSSQM